MPWILRSLGVADATSAERRATLWSAVVFGCVLGSYYLLRPMRERIAVDLGSERIDELFVGTLLAVTVLNPVVMAMANRMPSRRFVPLALHGVSGCLVGFALLFVVVDTAGAKGMAATSAPVLAGAGYFVWLSAVNVFAATLFWMAAVERFTLSQGRRLFGLVGVGGTVGAILGSVTAGQLSSLPPQVVMLVGVAVLEGGVFAFARMVRACAAMAGDDLTGAAVAVVPIARAGTFEGMRRFVRSPYLWGIGVYMLLLGVMSTAHYYQQNLIVGAVLPDRSSHEGAFALMNLLGNTLVLAIQLFLTGRILRVVGVGIVLCLLPLANALGLSALAAVPALLTLYVVDMARRGAQFALDKPAREVLYTPLSLEEKHKSKPFLDTFMLRIGDWIGALLQNVLKRHEATTAQMAWASLPVAVTWALLGLWLGRRGARLQPPASPADRA